MSFVVPGVPTFKTSKAGNGKPITVAGATGASTFSGTPIVGDIVVAQMLYRGSPMTGVDTKSYTAGASPSATSVAAGLEALIAADSEWTAVLTAAAAAGVITYTLVAAERPEWGNISIKYTITHQGGSTLAVAPNPTGFTPTGNQGLVSVVPLITFPYSYQGQQMTFYKGQVTDMNIALAKQLFAAGLVQ